MILSSSISKCGIKELKFNKFAQLVIFNLRKAFKEIT